MSTIRSALEEDGYALVPLLSASEVATLRELGLKHAAVPLADPFGEKASENKMATLNLRVSPGDGIEYAEHVPRLELYGFPELQDLVASGRIQALAREVLGADAPADAELILDSLSLLAAPAGYRYRQGFHRDVIGVPDAAIDTIPAMLSPDVFHNSCQINLPLIDDSTFAAVRGSHKRPRTAAEAEAFAHRPINAAAPLENSMPGGAQILIPAGTVMLCNNNLIHRGCGPPGGLPVTRLTLHGGFHITSSKPTVHFQAVKGGEDSLSLKAAAAAAAEGRVVTPGFQALLERRDKRAGECPDTIPHAGSRTQHAARYADRVAGKFIGARVAAKLGLDEGSTVRVAVLGGTGRVGWYLCPRLAAIERVHVISVSRGTHAPYPTSAASASAPDAAWSSGAIERVALDRADQAAFNAGVAALDAHIVVDLCCFDLAALRALTVALLAAPTTPAHVVTTSTIWALGANDGEAPTEESGAHGSEPLGHHGKEKRAMTQFLTEEIDAPWASTVIHFGHLCGRGWVPLNPVGTFDPSVFLALRDGAPVALPNDGAASLHHGHADDAAGAVLAALAAPERAGGEAFSCVAAEAITMRDFAAAIASHTWGGAATTPAILTSLPCPSAEFTASVGGSDGVAAITLEHVRHSSNCSTAKLAQRLSFAPKWTILDAVAESLRYLEDAGKLSADGTGMYVPTASSTERETTRA